MPFARYMPEHMGSATISPSGEFEAGSFAELTYTYTAGTFGIDDTGMLKISWRTTSDMGKPQLTDPKAPNYTTVEASNGAKLEVWFDRINIRPWANTLAIRVGRGFLREGETITVRFGDRRGGSPGLRLQTNCEPTFEFKTVVDAFAAYEFTEIASPEIALIPGPAATWKAILPTLAVAGEPFRLAILAEDRWGNPTVEAEGELLLASSVPIAGMPARVRVKRGDGPVVLDGLRAERPGDIALRVLDTDEHELCAANPLRIVGSAALRHYWGDLHGQSEETIGTNTVGSYFAYARDRAFLDIVGHQGNDFQISDEFWHGLNAVTKRYDDPGRFVAVPGYEWSGNTGMGGDRNVFFMSEARPIQRSSSILVGDGVLKQSDRHTAAGLFAALEGEDVVVTAHVGGRYADLHAAHDGRVETAVEIHSTWGTFEWLLHDAFDIGARVGVTCHSDDHKGRPGATRPGASHFGAIGGLTCYLMPELTRAALFDALRHRRHYGTTGMRMFLSVTGHFAEKVSLFDTDPALGPATSRAVTEIGIGDIVAPGGQTMRLDVEAIGSAPIERIDLFHGKTLVETVWPDDAGAPSRRIRVMWQGAEYRGRGREVDWRGSLSIEGGRYTRAEPVNFLNPENPLREVEPGRKLAWRSVTTGNLAGIDLWLEDGKAETIVLETHLGGGRFAAAEIGREDTVIPLGGLGRQVAFYRLPETLPLQMSLSRDVAFSGEADLPVYVRVTQADGNQAWSSPIYLIATP